jgi:hypothetical protein
MRLAVVVLAGLFLQASGSAPVRVIEAGDQSRIENARQLAVDTPDQFAALWREHASRPQPPVDFARESVVGVFLGTRSSAGFGVEIVSVSTASTGSVVRYRLKSPPAGAMTAQILTFPFVLAAVPKLTPPVRFEPVS